MHQHRGGGAQRHDIPREEPRLLTEVLRNMTIIVDFQSGGKTLYTGTTARLTSFKDHSKLSPLKNNFETQSTILIVFANVQEVDIARAAPDIYMAALWIHPRMTT